MLGAPAGLIGRNRQIEASRIGIVAACKEHEERPLPLLIGCRKSFVDLKRSAKPRIWRSGSEQPVTELLDRLWELFRRQVRDRGDPPIKFARPCLQHRLTPRMIDRAYAAKDVRASPCSRPANHRSASRAAMQPIAADVTA